MSAQRFHIANLMGSYMFRECIAFVRHGLVQNGYEVSESAGQLDPNAINIVFAAHCGAGSWMRLSKQAQHIIMYNWEPVSPLIGRFNQNYLRLMRNVHVWDYSAKNVKELREVAGIQDVHHVPMGYAPEMTVLTPVEQDIDVLFYGDLHPRRRNVIHQMRDMGLYVVTSEDVGEVTGAARDNLIARAKVVLNIHAFDFVHIFEVARVSYWLANKKAVVSEVSNATEVDFELKEGMLTGSIDELAQLCWDLVHNVMQREALEAKGFSMFIRKNAAEIIKRAVDRYFLQLQRKPPEIGNLGAVVLKLPTSAQIGAGAVAFSTGVQWNYSCCNIDARADFAPDWALDLSRPIPFGMQIYSERFGWSIIEPACFKKIIANDYFQTTAHFRHALTNCLDLLEEDGVLEVSIPLSLSIDAWKSTRDRRVFNEKSWERIVSDWLQYNWLTHRFHIISLGNGVNAVNPLGLAFLAEHDWDAALKKPRIIDVQQLVLQKRALNDQELRQLPTERFFD